MKSALSIVIFLLVFVSIDATAQTKAQRKAQKEELKRLKKMKPEEIKALMVKLDKNQTELEKCDAISKEQKRVLNEKDAKIAELEETLEQRAFLESQLNQNSAETTNPDENNGDEEMPVALERPPADDPELNTNLKQAAASGVYFRVQLAAFTQGNIPDKVSQELYVEEHDGYSKLLKGLFYTLEDAEYVRKYFKRLGIRDAWVVSYNNGVRIPKAEAIRLLNN